MVVRSRSQSATRECSSAGGNLMILDSVMVNELKRHARDAAAQAYAPYSRFRVGAAVLTDDGRIFAGCNVENASYGLSVCAERNAIYQAIAQGARALVAIVVYAPTPTPTPPCGACRQVMREFAADVTVVCFNDDNNADRRFALDELLPMAFTLDSR
jgi:cytidine deaminase